MPKTTIEQPYKKKKKKMTKKTEQPKRKNGASKVSKSKPHFDKKEQVEYIGFTLLYIFFIVLIGGIIKANMNDLYYVFGIPFDLQEGIFTIAGIVWIGFTLFLGMHYLKD